MTLTDLLTYDNFALCLIGVTALRGLYRKTFTPAPLAASMPDAGPAPAMDPATAHNG